MGKRERTSDRLNAKQMDKLSEIYDFFDKNGDGSLVRQKLCWACKYNNLCISFQTLEELIDSVNSYMDRCPNYHNERDVPRERIISVIRETVKCIDIDGNGT